MQNYIKKLKKQNFYTLLVKPFHKKEVLPLLFIFEAQSKNRIFATVLFRLALFVSD